MEESVAEGAASGQQINAAARYFWRAVIDWLAPPKCLICRKDIQVPAGLCSQCWSGLHLIDEPVCQALGIPFAHDEGEGALSPAAIADPPAWDRARAAAAFDETSRHIVHLLKYRDTQEAGLVMARLMAGAGRRLLAECDLIVPVPLYRFRLWQRRFNQAAFLAQQLAVLARKPYVHDVLTRRTSTRPQVGLSAEERQSNVGRAFAVALEKRPRIEGKTVLLVDDVRTTGATVGACSETLKAAGAARVDVLTFALVLDPARLDIDV